MSKSNKYTPSAPRFNETASFGAYRHADQPASAIQSGASSMPKAWQNRPAPSHPASMPREDSVRSFAEILKSPFIWCLSTKTGKILTGLAAATGVITLLA